MKILIADDDPICLRVVSHYLSQARYSVTQAMDGQQAWELLQQQPQEYELVILDRIMPHLHGIEVVKRMQQDLLLKNIRVIMFTGIADKEEVIEAFKAGVYDFLHKPIEKELLLSVVKKALRK